MNMHSTEMLDETFEMRLLTDAELNDVNGGLLVVAGLISFLVSAGVTFIIMSDNNDPLPEMPMAAWITSAKMVADHPSGGREAEIYEWWTVARGGQISTLEIGMDMHTPETLDQTFEMRLLTDAELNDVNGGVIDVLALFGFLIGGVVAVLLHEGSAGGTQNGDVYWPAA